ncbi:TonB-dependent receptor [Gilvimarinus sp. DA14]|uniref:TonB-dependent receptor n=1 Tax=Gilvimarinus sp. DA14 TaxID=2956798 RepID=UPI0020B7E3FC|nr:TonB-dependent receptor [Gilvimarinus sp. DA14]UTF60656.1 TonB-dependent receptor [Gilvimarinus sp. DA14]
MPTKPHFNHSKLGLLSLLIAGSATTMAQTANNDTAQSSQGAAIEEVVITGYRGSLLNSTAAKRDSVGFSDEVFSDDIGKMPSQNLAESLSRIPGVNINREVTGEGQQISVRGLGPSFTKVVLNGNSMSVASMGDMNQNGSDGRQVSLDIFPPELFKSLSVNKTATAQQIEGGVSGYVNMKTLRPSDLGEGHTFNVGVDGVYKEATSSTSPKGALTYSFSNDTFGVLTSVVAQSNDHGIDGYEVIGNVLQGVCLGEPGTNACADGSGDGLRYSNIATPDYAAAHPGVNVGDVIDISGEQATYDAMQLPYIGRMVSTNGKKDSISALVSLEYTPNDDITAALDFLTADTANEYTRDEISHFYRRNYVYQPIPSDIVLDSKNQVVSGTFYGTSPWIGSQDYDEETSFTSIMPSVDWQISDDFSMAASASFTDSEFSRYNPYGLMFGANTTLEYANDGIVPSVNYGSTNDYANYTTHDGEDRIRASHTERETSTTGFHVDFAYGEDAERNGFKFGIHHDQMESTRQTFLPVFSMEYDGNADGSVTMAEYLEGSGATAELTNNIQNYIRTVNFGSNIDGWGGVQSFGATDWSAMKDLIGFDQWQEEQQNLTNIEEEVTALYLEFNTETEIGGRLLRTNSGVRAVKTDQFVEDQTGATSESYDRVLPSFSAVYDLTDDIKLRTSASRSLTRANPSDMFPGAQWDGSGIDVVRVGNPGLAPFESTNLDIGGEWYFSDMGYVGLTYYTKDITGFTYQDTILENLDNLGQYGVDLSELTPTQLEAESICTPNCTVQVITRVNSREASTLKGFELIWVQPLDFLVEGLGFNASANKIEDDSPEGAEITGVSDSYNLTGYYENDVFQARVTLYHQEGAVAFNSWGQDVETRDRSQVDVSASYRLPVMQDNDLTLTFDAYNVNNEPLSTRFVGDGVEEDSQSYNVYYPGATYTMGVRASF